MTWQYSYPSNKAVHLPTGCILNIDYALNDFGIALAKESPKGAEAQLSTIISELKVVVTDETLKVRMGRLLDNAFGGDSTAVAYLLKELTGRNVSERTLQSWLMQTGKRSSRRCPEWAVNALQAYVEKNPDMRETYQARREQNLKNELEQGGSRLERAYNTDGLEQIERDLADDERFRARLTSASLGDLPNILSDILLKHERDMNIARSLIFDIFHEIQKAASLDDLKRDLNKKFDDTLNYDSFIQKGKMHLIQGKNEFANEHGLLNSNM